MSSPKKKTIELDEDEKKKIIHDTRRQNIVEKVRSLIQNGNYLSRSAFSSRKQVYTQTKTGLLHEKVTQQSGITDMMDPSKMSGMMTNMVMNFLPNIVGWGFMSFFFSGFLVAKFPLTFPFKFKALVQNGVDVVDLQALDSSYVTSVSLYFLIFLGLRGTITLSMHMLFDLMHGDDDNIPLPVIASAIPGMAAPAPTPAPGTIVIPAGAIERVFEMERENLIFKEKQHLDVLSISEDCLLNNEDFFEAAFAMKPKTE